jgi:hypothetical protein
MTKPANNHKPDPAEAALPAASETTSAGTAAAHRTAKNPAAVLLGRLGGQKGGPARARKLTPQQRSEIARKASLARWAKRRQQ